MRTTSGASGEKWGGEQQPPAVRDLSSLYLACQGNGNKHAGDAQMQVKLIRRQGKAERSGEETALFL